VLAACRAIDLSLPYLQPGKSLRFALLPEGQDPDDLVRAGGREAVGQVIGAARPLVDMMWARETEAGVFDTPERRAALEARLREIVRAIGDESVRRHYQQALAERVAAFFPAAPSRSADRGRAQPGRGRSRGRFPDQPDPRAPLPVSERLRQSPLVAARAAHPLREAVLVMTLINHPALLHSRLDEFAHLDLSSLDLDRLRAAVLGIVADGEDAEDGKLRERLVSGPFAALIGRLEGELKACGYWPSMPSASDRDADEGWMQALTLHRRRRALHKDLKEAEAALAGEPSEANLARLVDIQKQMASSEGTEALIEGFGASSGRQPRIF
jgi:DNA primase